MEDIEECIQVVLQKSQQRFQKNYEKKVQSLKAYSLPDYLAMKNYQESSLLQAILQCVNQTFWHLDTYERSAVVTSLVNDYKWPQDLYGLTSLLDINCIVFLSSRCIKSRRATRLYTKWAIKPHRPWALLFSDGFGLLWCAIKHNDKHVDKHVGTGSALHTSGADFRTGHRMAYLVDYQTGQHLFMESIQRACTNYTQGSIVLYNNEAYTIKESLRQTYVIESHTDSSIQLTVAKSAIEASVAPEAQSPEELLNRSEETRRRIMGLASDYTSIQFDVRHLATFAADSLKNN